MTNDVDEPLPALDRVSAVDRLVGTKPSFLVWCALAVFALNMTMAWTIAVVSTVRLNSTLQSHYAQGGTISTALAAARSAKANEMFLLHRVVEMSTYHQMITNRQTLLVVGLALCFGLMAIGFALFIVGVQGAYKLTAGSEGAARITLAASSPGIACFVLAAAIGAVVLTRDSKVNSSTYTVYPDTSAPAAVPPESTRTLVAPAFDMNAVKQASDHSKERTK